MEGCWVEVLGGEGGEGGEGRDVWRNEGNIYRSVCRASPMLCIYMSLRQCEWAVMPFIIPPFSFSLVVFFLRVEARAV